MHSVLQLATPLNVGHRSEGSDQMTALQIGHPCSKSLEVRWNGVDKDGNPRSIAMSDDSDDDTDTTAATPSAGSSTAATAAAVPTSALEATGGGATGRRVDSGSISMSNPLPSTTSTQGIRWMKRFLLDESFGIAPFCTMVRSRSLEAERAQFLRAGMRTLQGKLGPALASHSKDSMWPSLGDTSFTSSSASPDKHQFVKCLRSNQSVRTTVFERYEHVHNELSDNFLMFDGIILEDVRTSAAAFSMIEGLEGLAKSFKPAIMRGLRMAERHGVDVCKAIRQSS